MDKSALRDDAPTGPVTDYDRDVAPIYIRLLDAEKDGAAWQEAAKILLGIDPDKEPERAKRRHDSHLARARWMVEHGFRELLAQQPKPRAPKPR